jgi:hypothetical protein
MSKKVISSLFCLIFLISLHFDSIIAKKHKTHLNGHKNVVHHKKLDAANLTMPEVISKIEYIFPNLGLKLFGAGVGLGSNPGP